MGGLRHVADDLSGKQVPALRGNAADTLNISPEATLRIPNVPMETMEPAFSGGGDTVMIGAAQRTTEALLCPPHPPTMLQLHSSFSTSPSLPRSRCFWVLMGIVVSSSPRRPSHLSSSKGVSALKRARTDGMLRTRRPS